MNTGNQQLKYCDNRNNKTQMGLLQNNNPICVLILLSLLEHHS
ncbi:hypothetical protein HMPREF0765_2796 [Sphingobacterium spiritivorum ATCC 33300]|uniref:Uncharacterized protein n=1 Tax=Sphingobacterium spiritivorum ATCC 33300 TaxID=525372 RepID=C2FZP0_SPHSI|nr:hypothetical protein HMPREF0765_2796 [Sphingobacterium spiritivorum ATCC 33300]